MLSNCESTPSVKRSAILTMINCDMSDMPKIGFFPMGSFITLSFSTFSYSSRANPTLKNGGYKPESEMLQVGLH